MHSHEPDREAVARTHARPTGQGQTAVGAARAELPNRLDARAVLSLQRTVGNAVVAQLLENDEASSPVHEVVQSGRGDALEEPTKGRMEAQFGTDFSDVRVHRDAKATDSARSVAADAYTVGSNIVFNSGTYDPSSERGTRLLAHELTHVVQQRSGPVSGTPAPGGILVSDPSDAFEQQAEQVADTVTRSDSSSDAAATSAAAAVQREKSADEDEDETKS
jgi:Domain of unknown function (DUF4157)